MIPISIQPPPPDFDSDVRNPGNAFLSTTTNPTDAEWRAHSYWQKVIPYAADVYGRICAFCATRIWHSTGVGSIDHFIPKKLNPNLAYSWNNFRYVSSRFNSRKGIRDIIDPFTMNKNWFEIKFPEVIITVIDGLSDNEKKLANNTIKYLQLNKDDKLVDERFKFYINFINGEISFNYLASMAPFLASEIQRQNIQPNVR